MSGAEKEVDSLPWPIYRPLSAGCERIDDRSHRNADHLPCTRPMYLKVGLSWSCGVLAAAPIALFRAKMDSGSEVNLISSQIIERCMNDPKVFLASCAVCSISALHLTQTFGLRHRHQAKFIAAGTLLGLAASFIPHDRWITGKTAISYIPISISIALLLSILFHEVLASWATQEEKHSESEQSEKCMERGNESLGHHTYVDDTPSPLPFGEPERRGQ